MVNLKQALTAGFAKIIKITITTTFWQRRMETLLLSPFVVKKHNIRRSKKNYILCFFNRKTILMHHYSVKLNTFITHEIVLQNGFI